MLEKPESMQNEDHNADNQRTGIRDVRDIRKIAKKKLEKKLGKTREIVCICREDEAFY